MFLSRNLDDEDQSFVVAFRHTAIITLESGSPRTVIKFIMVFSTTKLLHRQTAWPVMKIDGTYKLMTLNYPLLVIQQSTCWSFYLFYVFQVCGFSDAKKTFFPTSAAISSHEDTWSYCEFMRAIVRWDPEHLYEPRLLIADGAPAITSGKGL